MDFFLQNLNTFFNNNDDLKWVFLSKLHHSLNDDIPRYFVPEVNSGNKDVESIVNDFINAGFEFI